MNTKLLHHVLDDLKIVGYQFQWTNPADNTDHDGALTKWVEVVPSWDQTMQQKIDELLAYRYSGKTIYRVRALYTHPVTEQQTQLTTSILDTSRALNYIDNGSASDAVLLSSKMNLTQNSQAT